MTSDAGERLADFGRSVMRLARPPVTLLELGRIPYAYEDLILDPMIALSDTCGALLGWSREPSPAARRGRPARESGLHATPDPAAYPHPTSYAAGDAPRDPRGAHDSQAGPRINKDLGSVLPRARIPGTVGSTLFTQPRRASEPLRTLLEEQRQTHPGSPETPTPPHPGAPSSGSDGTARGADSSRRPSRRGFEPNGATSSMQESPLLEEDQAGRSPSSEVRGPDRRPARPEWQEESLIQQSATTRADDGTSSETREGDISFSTSSQGRRHGFDPPGSTAQPALPEEQVLATDDTSSAPGPPDAFASGDHGETTGVSEAGAEHLAATLRAYGGGRDADSKDGPTPPRQVISGTERERSVVARGTVPAWGTPDEENIETNSTPPLDSARGGSRLAAGADRLAATLRTHVADTEDSTNPLNDDLEEIPSPPAEEVGRVNLEEIIERLAEELEDGIARTYGSSGG
jgi:hypothetical protein